MEHRKIGESEVARILADSQHMEAHEMGDLSLDELVEDAEIEAHGKILAKRQKKDRSVFLADQTAMAQDAQREKNLQTSRKEEEQLDRISLDQIHDKIQKRKEEEQLDRISLDQIHDKIQRGAPLEAPVVAQKKSEVLTPDQARHYLQTMYQVKLNPDGTPSASLLGRNRKKVEQLSAMYPEFQDLLRKATTPTADMRQLQKQRGVKKFFQKLAFWGTATAAGTGVSANAIERQATGQLEQTTNEQANRTFTDSTVSADQPGKEDMAYQFVPKVQKTEIDLSESKDVVSANQLDLGDKLALPLSGKINSRKNKAGSTTEYLVTPSKLGGGKEVFVMEKDENGRVAQQNLLVFDNKGNLSIYYEADPLGKITGIVEMTPEGKYTEQGTADRAAFSVAALDSTLWSEAEATIPEEKTEVTHNN